MSKVNEMSKVPEELRGAARAVTEAKRAQAVALYTEWEAAREEWISLIEKACDYHDITGPELKRLCISDILPVIAALERLDAARDALLKVKIPERYKLSYDSRKTMGCGFAAYYGEDAWKTIKRVLSNYHQQMAKLGVDVPNPPNEKDVQAMKEFVTVCAMMGG